MEQQPMIAGDWSTLKAVVEERDGVLAKVITVQAGGREVTVDVQPLTPAEVEEWEADGRPHRIPIAMAESAEDEEGEVVP